MKKLTNADLNKQLKEWCQKYLVEGELNKEGLYEGMMELCDIRGRMRIVDIYGEDK